MQRFPVHVAGSDQLPVEWWVVIEMVFLLLSTSAPHRINVSHILDRVGREMMMKKWKGNIHSVRYQTKGYAWIGLSFDQLGHLNKCVRVISRLKNTQKPVSKNAWPSEVTQLKTLNLNI
jgi:hypothetical protein